MKKSLNQALLLMFSLAMMSTSCSNDDDSSSNNSQQIAEIESIAQSGDWRITNFVDSGQNETADFNGYDFNFNSDGSLVASNGTTALTGSWSVKDDDSSNDDSNDDDDIDFNIFFLVPDSNDFEDLNDDWDIVSTSSTRIELIDISGGNGGTDFLTFEKN